MSRSTAPSWVPLFFAVSACSWVPHWACHYYRLETHSGFSVGSWQFTPADSVAALVVYALLIIANLSATIASPMRAAIAGVSGGLHLGFAVLHVYRIYRPFRFQVFGYDWSLQASLREAVILSAFGLMSLAVARRLRRRLDQPNTT